MTGRVVYKVNTSRHLDILHHLRNCDRHFARRLSERVDMQAYSKKIRARAQTFEAWSAGTLVGLVAAYMNPAKRNCYITSVSVIETFSSRGIARRLIAACLKHAKASGLDFTSLEVGEQNHAAQRVYKDFEFRTIKNRDGVLLMKCRLRADARPASYVKRVGALNH